MNEVGYPNFAIENFKRTSSIPISNTPKPKNAKTEKVKPKKFYRLQKFIFTNIAIENNRFSFDFRLPNYSFYNRKAFSVSLFYNKKTQIDPNFSS